MRRADSGAGGAKDAARRRGHRADLGNPADSATTAAGCGVRQSDNPLPRDDTQQREPGCGNVEHLASSDAADVNVPVARWHRIQHHFDPLAVKIGLQHEVCRARAVAGGSAGIPVQPGWQRCACAGRVDGDDRLGCWWLRRSGRYRKACPQRRDAVA